MFNEAFIEQRIFEAIESGETLSVALVIIRGAEIIYAKGFGRTTIEEPALPVTVETLHLIGLTSRTITTTMIMRLVEQGRLELDRPIVDYLPGYVFFANPDYGRQLTLRHLLSETSGLASGGRGWGPNNPEELRRFVWEEFSHFNFNLKPGYLPKHGNNPVLAGHIAEAVTGKYFTELVQELVLEPLEMPRTLYDRAVAMTYPLALPHMRAEAGNFQLVHRYPDNLMGNPDFYCISTARDLANLALMFLNEGRFQGEQFLTPETVRRMATEQANYRMQAASNIRARMEAGEALGLVTGSYKGIPCLGRPTAVHGMAVAFDLFPAQELGVVCLTNEGQWPEFQMLFDLYDHLLDRPGNFHYPKPPLPPDVSHQTLWPNFAGDYLSIWGDLASIRVHEGQLSLERGEQRHPLIAVNAEEYYFENEAGEREPVTFMVEENGAVQTVSVNYTPFLRIELDPTFVPDPSAWTAYEGLYANYRGINFIEGIYLYLHNNTLYALDPNERGRKAPGEGVPCQPLSQGQFLSDYGRFDFIEDEKGRVKLLILDGAFRYWRIDDINTREAK